MATSKALIGIMQVRLHYLMLNKLSQASDRNLRKTNHFTWTFLASSTYMIYETREMY